MRLILDFLRNEAGATAIEYGLIAAGISVFRETRERFVEGPEEAGAAVKSREAASCAVIFATSGAVRLLSIAGE